MSPSHYEAVPPNIQQEIVARHEHVRLVYTAVYLRGGPAARGR